MEWGFQLSNLKACFGAHAPKDKPAEALTPEAATIVPIAPKDNPYFQKMKDHIENWDPSRTDMAMFLTNLAHCVNCGNIDPKDLSMRIGFVTSFVKNFQNAKDREKKSFEQFLKMLSVEKFLEMMEAYYDYLMDLAREHFEKAQEHFDNAEIAQDLNHLVMQSIEKGEDLSPETRQRLIKLLGDKAKDKTPTEIRDMLADYELSQRQLGNLEHHKGEKITELAERVRDMEINSVDDIARASEQLTTTTREVEKIQQAPSMEELDLTSDQAQVTQDEDIVIANARVQTVASSLHTTEQEKTEDIAAFKM